MVFEPEFYAFSGKLEKYELVPNGIFSFIDYYKNYNIWNLATFRFLDFGRINDDIGIYYENREETHFCQPNNCRYQCWVRDQLKKQWKVQSQIRLHRNIFTFKYCNYLSQGDLQRLGCMCYYSSLTFRKLSLFL